MIRRRRSTRKVAVGMVLLSFNGNEEGETETEDKEKYDNRNKCIEIPPANPWGGCCLTVSDSLPHLSVSRTRWITETGIL